MEKPLQITGQLLTADHNVGIKPAFLCGLIATAGTSNSELNVYNGHSSSAEKILQIKVLANDTQVVQFREPILFSSGIYCDFDTNLTSVYLMYNYI